MANAMIDYRLDPATLDEQGIRTVIIASPDLSGRLFGRRVPAERFAHVIDTGVNVSSCVFAWGVTQDTELIDSNAFAYTGMHNGIPDVTLRVDVSTLRRAAWLDGVAICFADPVDVTSGEPLAISPRVLLKQELARHTELGYAPKTGTELEFYLFLNSQRQLHDDGFRGLVPTTAMSADFMIDEGNTYEPFFQKLRRDLAASGVEMEAAQSEHGKGQWEMTFVYGEPLEMADRHVLYKMAVRDSAQAAGMTATFMARPLNDEPGSSCHVHVSLQSHAGDALFWDSNADNNMSQLMRSAMGGLLHHSPEFMAWYAPTVNSWRRSTSKDVAGWGRTWGFDNRTVTARVLGHQPQHLRLEFRLPGADTNPYLTLAALLASLRSGIESGQDIGAPHPGNAYDLPRDEGMPTNLHEAVQLFRHSELAQSTFGRDTVEHHAILLEHEWSAFLSEVSSWDMNRYFERI
jgi:glutamine synthetase